jgi:hypothetical protein
MAEWCDPATTLASRTALVAAALAEDALLVAAHIATVGQLRREGELVVWEPAV